MRTKPIVLRSLGTAQVDIRRTRVRPLAVRRFAALLYLSAEAGRRVPRRYLIELLFPGQTERNGLHSLRELVYRLKSAGVALDVDQEGIELPARAIRADYAEMLISERLTFEQIRAAQGGFLPGYVPHASEAYKEWFEPFRTQTVLGLSRVLLRDHDRAREVANLELAEAAARAALAVSPLNDHAVKALAETMALSGAKAEAQRLLDDYAAEVGNLSPTLSLSAESVKRRIAERITNSYRSLSEMPFAGRDDEMLELRRHLVRSQEGRSQTVVIVGEPGIGKTRLVSEFAAVAGLADTTIVRTVVHPRGNGRPMGVLLDLLPSLLQLPGALGVSPDSMQLLVDLRTGAAQSQAATATADFVEAAARATDHAVHDLISAISSERHLTIIVDDAHWSDHVSLGLLFDLAAAESDRLLLLVTTRDPRLAKEHVSIPDASVIHLNALEHECVVQLSRRCLRGTEAEVDDRLQKWMAQLAQGNPLFLESLVTHYKSTGELFKVPSSLHELLSRRISVLEMSSVAVLQACVLLGALSNEKRLLACLEMRFLELVTSLNELQQLRLVDSHDGNVFPSHPLIAEVLQARSDTGVLRLIHRKIATVLEAEPGALQSNALLWEAGHHWASAGEPGRALEIFRHCAEHAHRLGRPADAANVLFRAAELELSRPVRLDVLKHAVRAAQRAGEFDQVLDGVQAIREIEMTQAHDDIELAEFAAMSVIFVASAHFASRALECVSSPDTDAKHRVEVGLAALKYADSHSVLDLARRVAGAVSDADLSGVPELLQLEFRMICHAALGELEPALPYARRLQEIAEMSPSPASIGCLFNAGHAYWRAGLFQDACTAMQRTFDLGEHYGLVRRQLSAASQLAIMMCDHGDWAQSQFWADKVVALRNAAGREFGQFESAMLELEFALASRDAARAAKVLEIADRRSLFSSPIRERWRRYVGARIRQLLDPKAITGGELADFMSMSSDTSSTGIREAEVGVICVALTAEGRADRAREQLGRFFSWRSRYSRGAISRQLQEIVLESGFGDLLDEKLAPAVWRTYSDAPAGSNTVRATAAAGVLLDHAPRADFC